MSAMPIVIFVVIPSWVDQYKDRSKSDRRRSLISIGGREVSNNEEETIL